MHLVLISCDGNLNFIINFIKARWNSLKVAWLLKENPSWSWRDAMNYVWKSRQILPAVEIRESILDYFESIEGHRRNY